MKERNPAELHEEAPVSKKEVGPDLRERIVAEFTDWPDIGNALDKGHWKMIERLMEEDSSLNMDAKALVEYFENGGNGDMLHKKASRAERVKELHNELKVLLGDDYAE